MEIFAGMEADSVLPLHLHKVTAAHGVGYAIVGTGSQYIEYRLVFFLICPFLCGCQAVLLSFCHDLIDVFVCLHGLIVFVPALKLVQQFKADP